MSNLITVYFTIGDGRRAKAYDAERLIGYSKLRGNHTNYCGAAGLG